MAAFTYVAIDAHGLERHGELQAPDLVTARSALRGDGLLSRSLVEMEPVRRGVRLRLERRPRRPKAKALQIFSRQFATMIEAGLSVVSALVILERQTTDRELRSVIAAVRGRVEAGGLLSEAMAAHPRAFDRLYISMIEAGEAAGVLDTVLDRVAVQIEKQEALRRRVRGAMVYPSVVLMFSMLVLIGMLLFLVPVFVQIFETLGGDLPLLTRGVVAASHALRDLWFAIFPTVALGAWSLARWARTERGCDALDQLALRLPLGIGAAVGKVAIARWSRTLSTLVGAGVDIVKALEITAQASGNRVVAARTTAMRVRVQEGATLAAPLVDSAVFPPMVAQMVRIGEETGELERMLGKVADFYEDEVEAAVQALTSIVEPVMMIGVGMVVGVIIIAMYLPMFRMLQFIE